MRRTSPSTPQNGPRSPGALRVRVVCALCLLSVAALMARLAYLQVWRHDAYVAQARQIRSRTWVIPPRRGSLLDRNGKYLVRSEPKYQVTLDPNAWVHPGDRDLALATLARHASIPPVTEKHRSRLSSRGRSGRLRTVELGKVDEAQAQYLRSSGAPGIGLREASRRVAIDGRLAPQVLGFTDADGRGTEGLEKALDTQLRGVPGLRSGEFVPPRAGESSWMRPIPGTVRVDKPVVHGTDIVLTIDAGLQRHVQSVLTETCRKHRAEAGTAVVLDPSNGDLLAVANWPTFDRNQMDRATPAAWNNRVASFPDEPGSTLKAVTLAAALEHGVVAEDQHFFCSGAMAIGRHKIHCAQHGGGPRGHGNESLTDVMRLSCNVATAQCAFKLGKKRLYQSLEDFGLTRTTGSGMRHESRGFLAPTKSWSQIQLANIGFGQGISVTPLQMAAAFGVFADGQWRAPRIIAGHLDPETRKLVPTQRPAPRRVISSATARKMRRMLQAVVERGTGKKAQLAGYTAGGKTGTAQIAEGRGYGGRYNASFVGLAPIGDPQLVIYVCVRAPKGKEHYGGEVAAPAFQKIAQQALLLRRTPSDRFVKPAPATGKESAASFAEH